MFKKGMHMAINKYGKSAKGLFIAIAILCVMVGSIFGSYAKTQQSKIIKTGYMSQLESPDCFPTSLYMLFQSIAPDKSLTKDHITHALKIYDGLSPRNWDSYDPLTSYVQTHFGVAPDVKMCYSGLSYNSEVYQKCYKTLNDFIKESINNDTPVVLGSTSKLVSTTGHAVLIVGYDDYHYYIHDPSGLPGSIYHKEPKDSVFVTNTTLAALGVSRKVSSSRQLLSGRTSSDMFNIVKPALNPNEKVDSLRFVIRREDPDLFILTSGTENIKKDLIEKDYNVVTFANGNTIHAFNASDTDEEVYVTFEFGRTDGSKKLPALKTPIVTVASHQGMTFGAFKDQINIIDLRDPQKEVEIYVKTSFRQKNGSIFHEETYTYMLEALNSTFMIKSDYQGCNKYKLGLIKTVTPPDGEYEWVFEHPKSGFKDVKTSDKADGSISYNFPLRGKYKVKANIYAKLKVKDPKTTTAKRFLLGFAESEFDVPAGVTLRYSQDKESGEYEFEADNCLSNIHFEWLFEDATGKEIHRTKEHFNTSYTFPDAGKYKVSIKITDAKTGELLAMDSVTVDVPKSAVNTKEVEDAFKAKDWKKLIGLIEPLNDKKNQQILDYLKILGDELKQEALTRLQKLEEAKTKDKKTVETTINPLKEELATLKKDPKSNKERISALSDCISTIESKHKKEQNNIDGDIQKIKTVINNYDNFYQAINPANDATKQLPQEGMFYDLANINANLTIDTDKAYSPTDYEKICRADNSATDDTGFKLTLKAAKKTAKPNEQIRLIADVENSDCKDYGPFRLEWSNNAAHISGDEGVFVATAPGTYAPTVTAYCGTKIQGSTSVTIRVAGGTTGKIKGLEESQVLFGSTKTIQLTADVFQSTQIVDNSCKNNPNNPFCVDTINSGEIKQVRIPQEKPGSIYIPSPDDEEIDEPEKTGYVVRFDSNCKLEFDPAEIEGNAYTPYITNVTFNRLDNPVKIWATILEWKEGTLETIGEADVTELEVIPPAFSIQFDPPQNNTKIGQEVRARVISNPGVEKDLIEYRWVEPTNRKELPDGSIIFKPEDNKPIPFHVIARVPFYGDTLDDKIKDSYTAGEYIVIAKLVGPKFDRDYQEWSAADKGLVTKKKPLITGQQIVAKAEIEDIDLDNVKYEWHSNDGCSIVGVTSSSDVTVSRSEAGNCTLRVVVYNKDNKRLGEDSVSFDISEEPQSTKSKPGEKISKPGTSKSQQDQQKDQPKSTKEIEAKKAIKTAQEEASKGNFEQAIENANKAVSLDPHNPEITKQIKEIKSKQAVIDNKQKEVNDYLNEKSFTKAEEAVKEVEKAYPSSSITKELKETLAKSKKSFVEKTLAETPTTIRKGDLETAIKDLNTAQEAEPSNTTVSTLLTKAKKDKETLDTLQTEFNTAMGQKNFNQASKILDKMKEVNHYYPPVVAAHTALSQASSEKRSALENQLEKASQLTNQGNIEEAINTLEHVVKESETVNYNESLMATASNTLRELKNKKANIETILVEAKRLMSVEYYDNARNLINNAKGALPNYPPVLALEAELNSLLAQQATIENQQKDLSQKAYDAMRDCRYDEAADLIRQATELKPDNKQIAQNAYDINNKRTIFLQDIDRAKLYLNRGDAELAKTELEKHASYCSNNPAYIDVATLIQTQNANKLSAVEEKISELQALLSAKEYTQTTILAKEIRQTLSPQVEQLRRIGEIESQAVKKLSEKRNAQNYLAIAQTHFHQYNYEGCLSQLAVLENQHPDCWEPSDKEPAIIQQLKNQAQTNLTRIQTLLPTVKNAVESLSISIDQLKTAVQMAHELVSLNPNAYEYGSYKQKLLQKLSYAENMENQQVAKAYAELKTAENLFYNNKIKDTINKFEGTFTFYNGLLNPSDPRYIHYQDVYRKASATLEQFNALENQYKDVFDAFNGEFDPNVINRPFAQRVRELAKKLYELLPNKQPAFQADIQKLYEAANKFEASIDQVIDYCKQLAVGPDINKTLEVCSQAQKFDPNNREIQVIVESAKKISSSPLISQEPVKVFDNGNLGGCSFTNIARFQLKSNSHLSEFKLWYNWQTGQNAVNYRLTGSRGTVKAGQLFRGDCDTYQKSWCNAVGTVGINLPAGQYTVSVDNGRICQNSGTGGNGTIRVFASPTGGMSSTQSPSQPIESPQTTTKQGTFDGFDGTYTGTCRFYGGGGDCKMVIKIQNNVLTGSMTAVIDGDNVTANVSGKVIPPGPQYSQNSAEITGSLSNGSIKDNTLNKVIPFTGSLSGNIYKPNHRANGTFSTVLKGYGGGPKGEWRIFINQAKTSSPAPTSVKTSPSVSLSPRVVYITFKNESSQPVHFYGMNGQCSPDNKVMPGQTRNINLKMALNETPYYVGRNGQTIGTVKIPLKAVQNIRYIDIYYRNGNQFGWKGR